MDQHIDTSYEPFSREPEYIEANHAFVETLPFRSAKTFLDLACGTGTISDLVLKIQPNITIFALDLSRESLSLGQNDFIKDHGLTLENNFVLAREEPEVKTRVTLIEGSADCLPFRNGWTDVVFMGNSIHMLPDLDLLLQEIDRVLVPGGVFAFNSVFYAGGQLPETNRFYRLWWQKAVEYITNKDAALKKQGLPGIPRKRGTMARARPWLSKDEWVTLLQKHGFEPDNVSERTIMLGKSSHQTVGAYSGFACVVLSGYSPEIACEALMNAVEPAMEAAGVTEVPRLWLEISARKPQAK